MILNFQKKRGFHAKSIYSRVTCCPFGDKNRWTLNGYSTWILSPKLSNLTILCLLNAFNPSCRIMSFFWNVVMSQKLLVNLWKFSEIGFFTLYINNTIFCDVIFLWRFFKFASNTFTTIGVFLLFCHLWIASKQHPRCAMDSITTDDCYNGVGVKKRPRISFLFTSLLRWKSSNTCFGFLGVINIG